ncbi:MAG: Mut7-C RNAse domain-containing protein [Candidatus Verstraetearchaeota archaeon]|nr:Mut7-C RNAse domain-containing protein [Candidatus Verstraetearchaeota archaeon]
MRFLADAMLGKLARWLRIIGYDTEYLPSASDEELISMAESESRLLLTRDSELFRRATRRGVPSLLLRSTTIEGELREISGAVAVRLSGETRCPLCNVVLVEDEKSRAPSSGGSIWVCPRCGKFYWHGTHWLRISATLRDSGIA